MFVAKAIKQVLTKFPIDISEAAQLHKAIEIVNNTESIAQQESQKALREYPTEKFEQVFPKYQDMVANGHKKAAEIIAPIASKFSLTSGQMEALIGLKDIEPIEGEAEEAVNE